MGDIWIGPWAIYPHYMDPTFSLMAFMNHLYLLKPMTLSLQQQICHYHSLLAGRLMTQDCSQGGKIRVAQNLGSLEKLTSSVDPFPNRL